ncbi:hypothetical protein BDP81DRAFT_213010 [Colletotrichum phormii]|uniref:Uncharacterized protein n=1 Tax=Colletotrichum phormii TaxID=359342 RepID=A0AAI9ZVG6_9PEZI|nr:uncharacterized protein BDP81DRAFT_213010 [Colletotrichum phormii]KAK1637728.1 hypothetical protein BDP81DRAFT_213010 [Colletotrichum phormii]
MDISQHVHLLKLHSWHNERPRTCSARGILSGVKDKSRVLISHRGKIVSHLSLKMGIWRTLPCYHSSVVGTQYRYLSKGPQGRGSLSFALSPVTDGVCIAPIRRALFVCFTERRERERHLSGIHPRDYGSPPPLWHARPVPKPDVDSIPARMSDMALCQSTLSRTASSPRLELRKQGKNGSIRTA